MLITTYVLNRILLSAPVLYSRVRSTGHNATRKKKNSYTAINHKTIVVQHIFIVLLFLLVHANQLAYFEAENVSTVFLIHQLLARSTVFFCSIIRKFYVHAFYHFHNPKVFLDDADVRIVHRADDSCFFVLIEEKHQIIIHDRAINCGAPVTCLIKICYNYSVNF